SKRSHVARGRPGGLVGGEPCAAGPRTVPQPLDPPAGGGRKPRLTQRVTGIKEPLARVTVRVSDDPTSVWTAPESSVLVLKADRIPAGSGGCLPELLPARHGMELQKGDGVLRVYAAPVAKEPSGILHAPFAQSHC